MYKHNLNHNIIYNDDDDDNYPQQARGHELTLRFPGSTDVPLAAYGEREFDNLVLLAQSLSGAAGDKGSRAVTVANVMEFIEDGGELAQASCLSLVVCSFRVYWCVLVCTGGGGDVGGFNKGDGGGGGVRGGGFADSVVEESHPARTPMPQLPHSWSTHSGFSIDQNEMAGFLPRSPEGANGFYARAKRADVANQEGTRTSLTQRHTLSRCYQLSAGNVLVAGGDGMGMLSRSVAALCGVDFDPEGSRVVDHFSAVDAEELGEMAGRG